MPAHPEGVVPPSFLDPHFDFSPPRQQQPAERHAGSSPLSPPPPPAAAASTMRSSRQGSPVAEGGEPGSAWRNAHPQKIHPYLPHLLVSESRAREIYSRTKGLDDVKDARAVDSRMVGGGGGGLMGLSCTSYRIGSRAEKGSKPPGNQLAGRWVFRV